MKRFTIGVLVGILLTVILLSPRLWGERQDKFELGQHGKSQAALHTPGDTVSRLCDHITTSRHKVLLDADPTVSAWSDGAILEFGTNFPAPLQNLIAKPTGYHDLHTFVKKLDARRRTEYQEAVVQPRSPQDRYLKISSKDGKISTSVDSLYVEYLRQRYPGATIWIKGPFDPIAFVSADELHAAVMPVKF